MAATVLNYMSLIGADIFFCSNMPTGAVCSIADCRIRVRLLELGAGCTIRV